MKAVFPSRWILFFAIALTGCAADLATKSWIFDRLGMPGGRTWWLWQDRIGLQTSLNEGALFGMGQGGVPVFVALSILACILAGILGYLYDRLGLPGLTWGVPGRESHLVHAVRDWILVMIFGRPWPNFNIADSLLVSGAILLLWHAWRGEENDAEGRGMQKEG